MSIECKAKKRIDQNKIPPNGQGCDFHAGFLWPLSVCQVIEALERI